MRRVGCELLMKKRQKLLSAEQRHCWNGYFRLRGIVATGATARQSRTELVSKSILWILGLRRSDSCRRSFLHPPPAEGAGSKPVTSDAPLQQFFAYAKVSEPATLCLEGRRL